MKQSILIYQCSYIYKIYQCFSVPPEVTVDPTEQDFQVGRKVSFMCVASGNPTPSYYWLRDGELLIPNNRIKISGNVLSIEKLMRDDEGSYHCLARNAAGESVAIAQLNYIGINSKRITILHLSVLDKYLFYLHQSEQRMLYIEILY